VADSVRRQRSDIESVDRSVENLADQAGGLNDSLEQFTVRGGSQGQGQATSSD
jgi:hypothetical protein